MRRRSGAYHSEDYDSYVQVIHLYHTAVTKL
jgi:hypothetical protein